MKRSPTRQFAQDETAVRNQYAALCWRHGKSATEVLLITSRETGRWVIPKGWPMEGHSPSDAAAIEAWEEAGVLGQVNPDCLGVFSYNKVTDRSVKKPPVQPCMVSVFEMEVTELAPKFPEQRQRRRKWFALDVAARKVAEPELKALLAGFEPSSASGDPDSGTAKARRKKR